MAHFLGNFLNINGKKFLLLIILWVIFENFVANANEDAKRLYDDLMVNYNRHSRPGNSPMEPVVVQLKLRLSQIIDVHELDQIMTCSVWLKQMWLDQKLSWNPKSYGGVSVLYVPYEMIWVPDIVLFNNADSNYNITINTKATLHYTGKVIWEPPAIFKSLCQIDIQWFPFDEQKCMLKFGSWTYPQNLLTLDILDSNDNSTTEQWNQASLTQGESNDDNVTIVVSDGIDLSDYYPSVEWDIMSRIAKRHIKHYPEWSSFSKTGSYVEIDFFLVLRRKPLFYTVNLVFPCVGISFLTMLVFYLPSDSGEKVSLCINILVALTMFFLLLIEMVPANSISLPFVGKYLLFTMILVTISVLITVVSLEYHFRKPTTHTMNSWVEKLFLHVLPKFLLMNRPSNAINLALEEVTTSKGERFLLNYHEHQVTATRLNSRNAQSTTSRRTKAANDERLNRIYNSPTIQKSFNNLCFIAELLKKKKRDDRVDQDWKYVAMVLDRLFLIIFSMICIFGTGWIFMQAPTFYDNRQPIDLQYRPDLDLLV